MKIFSVQQVDGDTCGNYSAESEPEYLAAESLQQLLIRRFADRGVRSYKLRDGDWIPALVPGGREGWKDNPAFDPPTDLEGVEAVNIQAAGFGYLAITELKVQQA